jgi:hypothetical protein
MNRNENAGVQSQMLESELKAEGKKKKLIIGGVIGLIVIISIILGVSLKKGTSTSTDDNNDTDGLTSNPMIGIYAQEPDFSIY